MMLPRCDVCKYEEDVWSVRTREEELAAAMKSRPCRDVAFMHHLLQTGWEKGFSLSCPDKVLVSAKFLPL